MVVGRDQRLFAAHEDVLCRSPFFHSILKGQFFETGAKKVKMTDEYVDYLLEPCAFELVLTGVFQRARNTFLRA
jgi:hypothetical protein